MAGRYRRSYRSTWIALLALALIIGFRLLRDRGEQQAPEAISEGVYRVERIVDGDTLLLENNARVRLIGVDTPETVKPDHPVEPWGPEATAFTRDFLRGGSVALRFDKERVDRYGRFLAFAYVGERMLNEELLRAGLARANLQYRYADTIKRQFRRAEDEAKASRRGIWSNGRATNKAA